MTMLVSLVSHIITCCPPLGLCLRALLQESSLCTWAFLVGGRKTEAVSSLELVIVKDYHSNGPKVFIHPLKHTKIMLIGDLVSRYL